MMIRDNLREAIKNSGMIVKVIAKDRTEAIAKARADFIITSGKEQEYSLSRDPEAKIRDIDIKLEFPNGNPYEVFGDKK